MSTAGFQRSGRLSRQRGADEREQPIGQGAGLSYLSRGSVGEGRQLLGLSVAA